jgi:transposase
MTQADVAQLSREELIDLVLAEHAQLEAAQELLAQMKLEIEALKLKLEKGKKPPTNSNNSSQPPSQDQKANLPAKRKKHRHGPPVGHVKYERKMVAHPDHIVEIKPQVCKRCQTDLSKESAKLVDVNQITELPDPRAEVIEVRQYSAECPCCGQTQVGQPPAGLEMERSFGARLEATVVYYRQQQHLSYLRTQSALHDLYRVEISPGGIDKIMQRGGKVALEQAAPIQAEVQQSRVVHCDETRARVEGQNWWQWVFCSASAVFHVIRFDRSVDVIKDVMANHEVDVWVSDCYSAQMKAPARERQLCLAHQLRNLQAMIDLEPTAFWPRAMQALFRSAVHLHNQRDHLSPPEFHLQVHRIERICTWLLERSLQQKDAKRLRKRYTKYRNCLFVFLHRTDVNPTNNVSERALRPSVIHRKVIGCFRSGWGATAYAALASVIATSALNGISAFDAIQTLFGSPALPLPAGV